MKLIRITLVIMMIPFILFLPLLFGGSDDGNGDPVIDIPADEDDTPFRMPWDRDKSQRGEGAFYANVEYRDEVHTPRDFEAFVKVHPAQGYWPGTVIPDNVTESTLHTWIRIRGISVPSHNPDRYRPHIEIDRERRRFNDGITFLWKLVSAAEYVILENPERFGKMVYCDVYTELGGIKVSIARKLVKQGHAVYADTDNMDWGHRDIRKKGYGQDR